MAPNTTNRPFRPPRPVSQVTASNNNTQANSSGGAPSRRKEVSTAATDLSLLSSSPPAETLTAIADVPTIPVNLLMRILHEHFKHDDTRITKEAMAGVCKYVEIFVREAIARADWERGKSGEEDNGFLEVEDLEKLAPQLLLDF